MTPGIPDAEADDSAVGVSRSSAEHYRWGNQCDAWSLLQADGIHVIEERMPPGTTEAAHYHRHSTQTFYVLQGTLMMELETGRQTAEERTAVIVRPGVRHRVRNESSEALEFLVISSPPSHDARVDVP